MFIGSLRRHITLLFSALLMVLLMGGCAWNQNPSCCNQVASAPGYAWKPCRPLPRALCCSIDAREQKLPACPSQPMDVATLIDIALQNNPITEQYWADARAAAFGVGIAKSALYPTVVGNEIFNYTDVKFTHLDSDISSLRSSAGGVDPAPVVEQTDPGGYTKSLTSRLALSYLLLDFGGRAANIEAARQALYSANWIYNRQLQDVIVSVLRSYYLYEGFKALAEAQESDLKNAKANLEAAEQLFEAGIKNKLDVLQARSAMLSIELNLVQSKEREKDALGDLTRNLGLPANTPLIIKDVPSIIPTDRIKESLQELIDIAKKRRPDLAAAFANYEEKKALITVARSAALPTLTANGYLQKNNYLNNPNLNNQTFSGSVALNIPIFSGFLYYNQIRQAKEKARSACAIIKETELNITLEVLTSYYSFFSAIQSLKYSEEYLKYSKETYDAAWETYKEGISSILDLLLAQRDLSQARASYVRARTNLFVSLANIAFATGLLEPFCEYSL